jgi:hypothetical protein
MPANYVLLEKITVGAAGASSVTFSGIPQTGYTDLVVKASVQANNSASSSYALQIAYNGNAANYSEIWVRGSGASATSSGGSGLAATYLGEIPSTFVTNTFGNAEVYIPNYTGSNNKSFSNDGVSEANSSTAWATLTAGLWANTSAITSITLSSTVNLAPNSTFYLYGVAKLGTTPAISPKATGGDIIETDGTYWYHAFLSSGTFTPTVGLSCDVLVVAGGGGGGSRSGGGGGAGGLYYTTTGVGTAQTVTVGAGGTGGSRAVNGTNGSNSVFGSLTAAVGGGFGGSAAAAIIAGNAGGSGGGGCNNGVGGTATSGQGFAGGSSNSSSFDAGGGGGAGAVGANASTGSGGSGAGAGGAGVNTYSTWLNTTGTGVSGFIAGGGGGGSYGSSNHGAGGSGGGGAGADSAPTAGTANTGGGGGGAGNSANTNGTPVGANGGSGLVIVRYAV